MARSKATMAMSSAVDTVPLVDSARSIETCSVVAETLRLATPIKGTAEVAGGLAVSFRVVCSAVTTAGATEKAGDNSNWQLTQKFFDYLEANAGDYWSVPNFDLGDADAFVEIDEEQEPSAHREFYERALRLIRNDFEERTWKAFWRSAIDEQSSSQVAEELGMTSVAVRKAKSRVLMRLRAEFGELIEMD